MRLLRRRFLVPFLLLILGILFLHFNVFYHVKGWIRGDAYFKGMPTCYWADEVNEGYTQSSFLKKIYRVLGLLHPDDTPDPDIFYSTEPVAAPVLLQLTMDRTLNPEARRRALRCLVKDHPEQAVNFAWEFFALFSDNTEAIRFDAAVVFVDWGDQGRNSKRNWVTFLKDTNPDVQLLAACVLWTHGEDSKAAGPLLVDAVKKGTSAYFGQAAKALEENPRPDTLPILLPATKSLAVRRIAVTVVDKLAERLDDADRATALELLRAVRQEGYEGLSFSSPETVERLLKRLDK